MDDAASAVECTPQSDVSGVARFELDIGACSDKLSVAPRAATLANKRPILDLDVSASDAYAAASRMGVDERRERETGCRNTTPLNSAICCD